MEVFELNPNHAVHEKLDMEDLQTRYDTQRVYVRGGLPQEKFVKIVVTDVRFVRFDRYFSSRLKILLVGDSPRIPQSLLELIRPKDHAKGLKVSHNWEDIIPYVVSIVFRVYGFLGRPHVLSYQVPLKTGIVELLWQIGSMEKREFLGKSKCTFFPQVTIVHNFIFIEKGWRNLEKFLDKNEMAQSHSHFIYPEGFNEFFRERTKAKAQKHLVYFPEDIVRNKFSLLEQEVRKEKWKVLLSTEICT